MKTKIQGWRQEMDDELENTTENSQENYKWISLQSMHRDAMCCNHKSL
jgi:hypothetical protein